MSDISNYDPPLLNPTTDFWTKSDPVTTVIRSTMFSPEPFSAGDDFTLLAFRAENYLQYILAGQLRQCPFRVLDDDVARQLSDSDTPIASIPREL